ncbi:hypothetical protein P0W64_17880 [Tsukamurella sp. 8F]|uniref:hypothetical protein n=1 Tax=unclassified Tsukamurella TaxID=2633480 RepID=UPI0023BA2FB4|nr:MULTISPECIES: hypothetical protein [unclassified Tsukamurella]MDF0529889.1 hypothetical protein [Tsukamurella sp. 8J]MDF0588656.1 hypothetical protein [Tsukamurella sp. 8F]
MELEPHVLTSLDATLDLEDGMFFASCFGTRVPEDLVAAVTVHGAATNQATAGFASPSRSVRSMPVTVEHWDAVPRPAGDWDRTLRTQVCLDTSGELEFFSGGEVAFEFPVARGYYELEGCSITVDGSERWRLRLWHSDQFGPDLTELDRISRLAR